MGDPRYRREAVQALEFMIKEYALGSNCITHDADLPFPSYLRDVNFHLIVLGPTFLCNRYHKSNFDQALRNYDFIRTSDACKVALPQDDYDCSAILDRWMVGWNIDRVYSVCPESWEILYPNYLKFGDVKLGYTGYISDRWIDSWANPMQHENRDIDVSYRASDLPANFGSLGKLKGDIARRFIDALPDNNLRIDISVDRKDLILGSRWHHFIENSKFCLTTPSGSSLLDPEGNFRQLVKRYCLKNPSADYHDIAQTCFPGEDGRYIFTAISPRNIEAALAETVQIATQGSYSELMRPLEHFIPLEEDCSNITEVVEMMQDRALVKSIQMNCKSSILDEPRLRIKTIVDEIITFAEEIVTQRQIISTNQEQVERLFSRYEQETGSCSKRYWRKHRVVSEIKSVAVKLGARWIKNFVFR